MNGRRGSLKATGNIDVWALSCIAGRSGQSHEAPSPLCPALPKHPKAVAKIIGDQQELLAFYGFPAEH